MLFPTVVFGVFFPIVFVGSWLLRPHVTRWKLFMLVSSYVFYGWWDWHACYLLALVTVANQAFVLAISGGRTARQAIVSVGVVANAIFVALYPVLSWLEDADLVARDRDLYQFDMNALVVLLVVLNASLVAALVFAGVSSTPLRRARIWLFVGANFGFLGYFKYYDFFTTSVADGFEAIGLNWNPRLVEVVLPIGISFFIFQALSYVIDAHRDRLRPVSLLDFAVYLSFFPHLVAGPIVRASEFLPQLRERPDPRYLESAHAFRLILAGMFKKVVISSFMANAIVDDVFNAPANHSSAEIVFSVYAYAIQIYADFSGYTDIAIGLALLLGIRFPQNFDSPYTARSIQDFWRRWHMTLSRWLRDYVYISLGGNRKGRGRTYVNLMATMLIGGLWHGAAWTFVAWGGIHGGVQAVDRWLVDRREQLGLPEPSESAARWFLQWFVTFHIVCFAWIFFRAPTFTAAGEMITGSMTRWEGPVGRFIPVLVALLIGVLLARVVLQIVDPRVALSGVEFPALLAAVTAGLVVAVSLGYLGGTESELISGLLVATIGLMLLSQFVPTEVVTRLQVRFSYAPLALQGVALAMGFWVIEQFGDVSAFIYFQF